MKLNEIDLNVHSAWLYVIMIQTLVTACPKIYKTTAPLAGSLCTIWITRSIKKSAPIHSAWMVTKPAGPSCQVQHAACCCLGFWIPSQAASRGSGGVHIYELGHRHIYMQERTTAILLHKKWFLYGKSKVAVFLFINSLGISHIYSAL